MFGITSPSKISEEIIIKAVDDYNFIIMQFIIPVIAGIGFILSIMDIFIYKFMNYPDIFIIVGHWILFLPFFIMTFFVGRKKYTHLFTLLSISLSMVAMFGTLIYDLVIFGHIVVYAYGSMALFMIYVYRPRDLIKLILFSTFIFAIVLFIFHKRNVPELLRSDIINAVFIFILSLMLSMGKFHHLMNSIISNETIEKKNKEIEIKNKMLNETLSKAQGIDEEKDTFIANISHELKTPISVISGYISILKSKNIFKGEDITRFEAMDRNVIRLLNTVNELLDIVGLESGERPFEMKEIVLKRFFKEISDDYKELMKEKGIDFSTEIKEAPTIIGDKKELRVALDNIIMNAYKFTSNGEKIDLTAEQIDNNKIKISVCDTGTGISSESISHVFEKFYQASSGTKRKFRGIGLGLTIAKGIIEKHDSKLELVSEKGKGTTFYFTI